MILGPLDLLIIQGTPFCNIDCTYCYLPDRLSKKKITLETVDKVLKNVFRSGIVKKPFSIVWHAGEPLVMPIDFYRAASKLIKDNNTTEFSVNQTIQTNGTLLSEEWCDFINEEHIHIGLSLDGPQFIHDLKRRDRAGRGTHKKVMSGLHLMRANEIPFYVIAVVSDATLAHPDEFFHFFLNLGVTRLCINIEEAEGLNRISSLSRQRFDGRLTNFLSRLYELYNEHRGVMEIREFAQYEKLISRGNLSAGLSQQTTPLRILNVDSEGGFSTFSPELLGMEGGQYGDFQLGNLLIDEVDTIVDSPKFRKIYGDIIAGVIACKKACDYFDVCGGGTPSNKFSENGSFATTETQFCRMKNQNMFELVFTKMERLARAEGKTHPC